jgi:uncharacterized repeat protein (TIGR01451 family)
MLTIKMLVLALSAALAACGGGGGSDGEVSADVVAQAAVAAQVRGGDTAVFTATVSNSGPDAARNLTITPLLASGFSIGTVNCAASANASCPATDGLSWTVATLPVGGTLTFSIEVPVPTAARGEITGSLEVALAGDPVLSNNAASAVTIAEDARNDTYQVYATNGSEYQLTLDFDAETYAMAGEGLDEEGSFTPDATAGSFTIEGNAKFRVAPDLIVGGFDFGGGVKPFVAGRTFAQTLQEVAGTYSMLGINLPDAGAADSRIVSARIVGSTLTICNDNIIYAVADCPNASRINSSLTVNEGEFTGIDAVNNETSTFRVARSGDTLVYLRAGTVGNSKRVRIALRETNGLAGGSFFGSSTQGAWNAWTLTDVAYSTVGTSSSGASISDAASLNIISTVPGIRRGNRDSDGANVFVMQDGPIAVLVGSRGGPAAGHMEIAAP